MKKTILLALVCSLILCVVGLTPSFAAFSRAAFDGCLEEYVKHLNVLEDIDSAGMSGDEARSGLAKAKAGLRGMVAALSDRREIGQARKAAEAWVKRGGTEAVPLKKAGNEALRLLDEREKELAAGRIFYINVFTACIEDCVKYLDTLENTDTVGMSQDLALAGLDRAEKKLRDSVALISSPKDIARARKVAEVFIKRGGTEATALKKAGTLALKYVEERRKHLRLYTD